MSERGKGTCSCERCGNYCHRQQGHCDSCQEVRRLREVLEWIVEAGEQAFGTGTSGAVLAIATERSRDALEETP